MLKKILLGFSCLCCIELHALDLELAPRAFFVYERGPVTTGASPALGLDLSAKGSAGRGELFGQLGLFSGAMIGETLGFTASGGYYFHTAKDWRPGIGLSYTLDFGSRLIASSVYAGVPPRPLSYLGLRFEPLRYQQGSYTRSRAGIGISLALCEGPPILRTEFTLSSLGFVFDGAEPASEAKLGAEGREMPGTGLGPRPSLSFSYGVNTSILGYGFGGFKPLSLDASLAWKDMELSLGLASLADSASSFATQWLFSTSLAFSPNIGAWNPALGIGWLYADPGHSVNGVEMPWITKSSLTAFHFVMKPLRYSLPISPRADLILSFFELRYGSIFPTPMRDPGEAGSFALITDIARVGLRVKI
jgi:hypothetical protein